MRRDPDRLRDRFDLVVLGGGCTGAGVALDAALRGLRVALIDRNDFAAGTSSLSTKLVHGGLRYLEHGEFGLVYEALAERRRLLRNAPHLVTPLRFVIPFRAGDRVPGWKWRAGLLLYDALAGPDNLRRSRPLSAHWLRTQLPLRPDGLTGGAEYSDAQMDDARLGLEIVRAADEQGAAVCNYVEAVAFERPDRVRCLDRIGGGELRIEGQVIVNATGPWSDGVRRLAGEPDGPRLAPTKGVHVVAPCRGLRAGLLLLHPRDGRVFFALPWLGKTLLGTTDTEYAGPPDRVPVTEEDIAYLLEGYNHHLAPGLDRRDVLGSFAGVRPLLGGSADDPSGRSREWRLQTGPSGLISVTGGKWTTYRHMAEQITDEVMRRLGRRGRCRTRAFRLGAPEGDWGAYAAAAEAYLRRRHGLTAEAARHLLRRYGRRAGEVARMLTADLARPVVEGEPDLLVELEYARACEMAVTDEDLLLRRTRLGLFRPALLGESPRTERH